MGDLFPRWLSPTDGPVPFTIHANFHQVFAYRLPDGGRLAQYLGSVGPQQFTESDCFISRLREAVDAWKNCVDDAAIIVLRHSIRGSVLDEEIQGSLREAPTWLAETTRPQGRA